MKRIYRIPNEISVNLKTQHCKDIANKKYDYSTQKYNKWEVFLHSFYIYDNTFLEEARSLAFFG
jgi:hypothetical protein